jgi:hypothetical protein
MRDPAAEPENADLAAARHVNDLHEMHVDHVNHLTALVHKAEANMTPKPIVDGLRESVKEARSILSVSERKLSKLNPLAPKEAAQAPE